MAERPEVVAFDLVETIAGLEPVAERLAGAGLSPEMLPRWFTQVMQDGFALTICEEYRPFARVAGDALAPLLQHAGVEPTPAVVQGILAGFGELPAQPDLLPALRTLQDAGVRMLILANGNAESASRFVERNGLSGLLARVVSAGCGVPLETPFRRLSVRFEGDAHDTGADGVVTAHGWDTRPSACRDAHRLDQNRGGQPLLPPSGGPRRPEPRPPRWPRLSLAL